MIDKLIDFFFPRFCPICGELDIVLCDICERELGTASQICPICGEESLMGWTHGGCKKKGHLDGLISLFEYGDSSVRKVIDSIKYDFNKELIPRLFKKVEIEIGERFDFVVPVPLHYYRSNWRGFNQAELTGKALATKLPEVGFENLLIRKVNTPQQVKMLSREKRKRNVIDVFDLNPEIKEIDLKYKKVLLVDDVFTTGASMGECCKVLKSAGVEVVWGFTLAH